MAHFSYWRRIENPYARSRSSSGKHSSSPVDAIDFDSIAPSDAVLLQAVQEVEQWVLRQGANHKESGTNKRPRTGDHHGSFPTIATAADAPVARSITQSSCDTSHCHPEGCSPDEEDDFWNNYNLPAKSSPPGALTQMVAEEQSKQEDDEENARIAAHLQQMRSFLEKFVSNLLAEARAPLPRSLYETIDALKIRRIVSPLFAQHMHELRNLGNLAAHGKPLPCKKECERVVKQYQDCKKLFEKSKNAI